MIKFSVTKKSKKSRARLGRLQTSHGAVETPSLVPVATQAAVKALPIELANRTGSQIFICNTFHLHLQPGSKLVAKSGGLHKFMACPRPLMTDSGGFQVFSLGFGRDQQVGKVLKFFPGEGRRELLHAKSQPSQVKITERGVHFRSPRDGARLFIGPKESMRIQSELGADIIFAFDECTSPLSTRSYIAESLKRTHAWAKLCLKYRSPKQALFGIVQGSHYRDLRQASARFIGAMPFDGFGIGGDLGRTKEDMRKILDWTVPYLPDEKPRHLLGVGHLEDIPRIIRSGIDLFDCTVPTHMARRGVAYTSAGKIDLTHAGCRTDNRALDARCDCNACASHSRAYLAHLFRAGETSGPTLVTMHNLTFFNRYVARLREKIAAGRL